MFFSNPVFDMQVTIALVIISAVIALIFFARSKNLAKALVIFSVLANLSFLVNVGSFMYLSYGLVWLQYFSLLIWPIINIAIIIKYFKKQKNATK